MSYQTHILNRYKETYPKHTLNEISKKTGIQVTRVFRILNGSEMKVSEYESFENAIDTKSYSSLQLLKTAKKCLATLSEESLNSLVQEMNLKLKLKNQVFKITNHSTDLRINA